ncbi:protein aveugle-like isoform X2 [Corvus kubaryi]|nr:protein aveugle-like isoform X2 [Corvus kubaryi]XP_041885416.1 protein aveugle-like isoform X2 [Corvus kubaryi]
MEAPAQDGAEAPLERCPEAEGPRGQPGSPSPPPAGRWSGAEVGSWLAAHGGSGGLAELAREHALTGRALLRLTEGSLRRMGVTPRSRRRELLRELLRLRLQQEIQELRSIAGEGR